MQLSKRDYFAAKALTGLLARSTGLGSGNELDPHANIAAEAFLYADAMIKLSKTLMDPVEVDPEKISKPNSPPGDEKKKAPGER